MVSKRDLNASPFVQASWNQELELAVFVCSGFGDGDHGSRFGNVRGVLTLVGDVRVGADERSRDAGGFAVDLDDDARTVDVR